MPINCSKHYCWSYVLNVRLFRKFSWVLGISLIKVGWNYLRLQECGLCRASLLGRGSTMKNALLPLRSISRRYYYLLMLLWFFRYSLHISLQLFFFWRYPQANEHYLLNNPDIFFSFSCCRLNPLLQDVIDTSGG